MIKKKFFFALLISLILADITFSQIYYNSIELPENAASDCSLFNIIRIETVGNYKTKDYVLRRELYFNAGDQVNLKEIFLAQKRILNLFLFNRVMFDLVGDEEGLIIIITVAERWYIFPLPILYLNERSWSKISYGGKLLYYNFMGRNVLLNLTAAFGYNPQLKFSYRNLWFGGNLKLLTNFSIYKSKVKSQNLDYRDEEDKRVGFDWLIGRRVGYYFYIITQISYLELQHPEMTLSPDGKDKLPCISISFQYDNRDLKEYPHSGYNLLLWGKKVKSTHPINYYRYGVDLRGYFPVTHYSTIALRGAANLADGLIPLYDRAFIGYLERIRGKFHQKYEGENLIIGGAEFRFPITKIRYIDLSEFALPGFASYYQNLKFGISGGIFYDYGAVWNQAETLSKKDFHYGFGAGLHFHIPYVELLRLEVGFDKKFNHEFIFEIGVAF